MCQVSDLSLKKNYVEFRLTYHIQTTVVSTDADQPELNILLYDIVYTKYRFKDSTKKVLGNTDLCTSLIYY